MSEQIFEAFSTKHHTIKIKIIVYHHDPTQCSDANMVGSEETPSNKLLHCYGYVCVSLCIR
jgi:hypothetical protein